MKLIETKFKEQEPISGWRQLETGEYELINRNGYKYLFASDKKTKLFDGYYYQTLTQLESGEFELTDKDDCKYLFTSDKKTKLFEYYKSLKIEGSKYIVEFEDRIETWEK